MFEIWEWLRIRVAQILKALACIFLSAQVEKVIQFPVVFYFQDINIFFFFIL